MKVLTLLIPTYNRKTSLVETVNNFANQIIKNHLEDSVNIFVSDNCSTDGAKEELLKLKEQYGDILQVTFQEKNLGMGGNFKYLIDNCKAKYLQLCSDDDIYDDEMIAKTLKIIEEKEVDYIFLNCYMGHLKHNTVMIDSDFCGELADAIRILDLAATHISPTIIRTELVQNLTSQNAEWGLFERIMQIRENCKAYILASPLVRGNVEEDNHWLHDKFTRAKYFCGLLRICIEYRNYPLMKNVYTSFSEQSCLRIYDLTNKNDDKYYLKKIKKYKTRFILSCVANVIAIIIIAFLFTKLFQW